MCVGCEGKPTTRVHGSLAVFECVKDGSARSRTLLGGQAAMACSMLDGGASRVRLTASESDVLAASHSSSVQAAVASSRLDDGASRFAWRRQYQLSLRPHAPLVCRLQWQARCSTAAPLGGGLYEPLTGAVHAASRWSEPTWLHCE